MKKLISALLAAAVCMTSAPFIATFTASADSSTEEILAALEEKEKHGFCGSNASWDLEDSTLKITGTGEIYVSGEAPWAKFNDQIFTVTIGEGITEIKDSAFKGCKTRYITIAESVKSVGANAFENCTNLEKIVFPMNVSSIGKDALKGCTNLKLIQVTNPDCDIDQSKDTLFNGQSGTVYSPYDSKTRTNTVNIYGVSQSTAHAYADKYDLIFRDYTITPDVVYNSSYEYKKGMCGESVFWSIDDNGTLKIFGEGKTVVWEMAQYVPWHKYRNEIKSVEIAEGVTQLGSAALSSCVNLKSVSLPSTLETICMSAFSYCSKLETIDIPAGVTTIGSSSFKGCDNLKEIIIRNPECKIVIGTATLSGKNATIYGYTGSTAEDYAKKYEYKFSDIEASPYKGANLNKQVDAVPLLRSKGMDGSEILECGDIIHGSCYAEDEYYKSPTWFLFDDTLIIGEFQSMKDWTAQGMSPFSFYKTRIKTVIVKSDSVGAYAFAGFTNLKTVVFPYNGSFKNIGANAFDGCTSLETIVLPQYLTSVGKNAFRNCSSLKSITVSRNSTQILGDGATISNKTVDGKPVYTGIIYGTAGSPANTYAKTYGYNFSDFSEIVYNNGTTTTATITKPVVTTTTTVKPTTTATKPAATTTTTTTSTTTTTTATTTSTAAPTTTTTTTAASTTSTTSAATTTSATKPQTTSSTTVTTTVSATTTVPSSPKGDLNGDGMLNVADLVYMQRVLLGIEKDPQYPCDVNGDGVNDIFDLVALRKLIIKSMLESE